MLIITFFKLLLGVPDISNSIINGNIRDQILALPDKQIKGFKSFLNWVDFDINTIQEERKYYV